MPRQRLEGRAGEVSKAVTRKNFVYDYLVEKLIKVEGAVGCVNFQVFADPVNEEIKAFEINPRFGGGYPLTSAAGKSFSEFLIREYMFQEVIEFTSDWCADLTMLRYDAKVIVNPDV